MLKIKNKYALDTMSEGATGVIDNPAPSTEATPVQGPEQSAVVAPQPSAPDVAATVGGVEGADPQDVAADGQESTDSPENAELHRIAAGETGRDLIDAQIDVIGRTPPEQQTPAQKALAWVENYRNPNKLTPQSDYARYPDGIPTGGLTIENADGTSLNVTAFKGETISVEGSQKVKSYTCVVEGKSDPVQVNGADLAKAQLAKNAPHVGAMFAAEDGSSTPTQELAEWYANGAEGTPPVDAQGLQGVEEQLAKEAGIATGSEQNEGTEAMVQNVMDALLEKRPQITETSSPQDRAKAQKIDGMLGRITAAGKVDGPLRAFAMRDALAGVQGQLGNEVIPSLGRAQGLLEETKDSERQAVVDQLKGKVPDEQLKTLDGLLEQDVTSILELFGNGEIKDENVKALQETIKSNPEISNFLLGGKGEAAIYQYLDKAADQLPEKDKQKLKALLTGGAIAGGVLLALLLVVGGLSQKTLSGAAGSMGGQR